MDRMWWIAAEKAEWLERISLLYNFFSIIFIKIKWERWATTAALTAIIEGLDYIYGLAQEGCDCGCQLSLGSENIMT
jgi:hypothetical protein